MFVTFEGIDGSGKSTQVELLRLYLVEAGRTVVVNREPGGTEIGERIRELLLRGEDMLPWTEASLFAAARAELVGRIVWPALSAGHDVILDRYIDSTLVYQGSGRGLPRAALLDWNLHAVSGLLPERTFVLTLPAEDATERLGAQLRLFEDETGVGPPDRMEREEYWFRRSVDDAYRSLARQFPARIVEIDASLSKKKIAGLVRKEAKALTEAATPVPQGNERFPQVAALVNA